MKSSVLIIEDEAIIGEDIQFSLEDEGYKVPRVFAKGEQALQWLETNHVDVILMDVLLAGEMDGIETAEKIRDLYTLPIVYLTSFTNEQIVSRAKLTSPFGYIVKPFKNRELFATIEMALYKHHIENKLKQGNVLQNRLDLIQNLSVLYNETLHHHDGSNSKSYEEVYTLGNTFSLLLNKLTITSDLDIMLSIERVLNSSIKDESSHTIGTVQNLMNDIEMKLL